MSEQEKLIHEPNTTQIPNIVLDHWIHELDELEFKVLLFICRKTFGWRKKKDRISISQICEFLNKTERPIQKAINRLIHFKLLIRTFNKTSVGDNAPNSYEINVIQLNKKQKVDRGGVSEATPPSRRMRHPLVSDGTPTKPTTLKPTTTKGNACEESIVHNSKQEEELGSVEVLPFSINENEKAKPKSKSSRKYPRPPHEEETFQWLKTLKLNTNEDTLSFWAHTYARNKLESAWAHLSYKMLNGYTPDNLGGFFLNLVKTENSPITNECLENKKLAEIFKGKTHWASLHLHERFCCEESRPDYDLPYRIATEDFKERLLRMWELKTGRQYQGQQETKEKVYEDEEEMAECYED